MVWAKWGEQREASKASARPRCSVLGCYSIRQHPSEFSILHGFTRFIRLIKKKNLPTNSSKKKSLVKYFHC